MASPAAPLIHGMDRRGSHAVGQTRLLSAVAAVSALALIALASYRGLDSSSQAALLQEQPQRTTGLYQIGDQEFMGMDTGSVEDMAGSIEKYMANEKILLKKILKRVHEHQRVHIDVVAGQIGPKGPPGFRGYPGIKGFPGARGPRGGRGPTGPRGPMGPKGIKGPKGIDGGSGPHGSRGNRGPNGPQGPRGRRGRKGPRGKEGKMGTSGAQGDAGKNGVMGPQGLPAPPAPPGVQGPPGPPGLRGRNGDPGAMGDRGPQGTTGLPGKDGAPGAKGTPGIPGKSLCGMRTNIGKNVCCGFVEGKDFKYVGGYTFQVDVDTSKCGFTGQPKYFTSLENKGYGEYAMTVENIENPKNVKNRVDPESFRVMIRSSSGLTSTSSATYWKWKLNWCAFGDSEQKPAHYAVCCGSTKVGSKDGSGAWKYSRWNRAKQWVDTSGCGWTDGKDANRKAPVPPMYFTSISDTACGNGIMNSGQCAVKARGYDSPRKPTSKGFEIYVGAMPGEKSINYKTANKNGWQINWCAMKLLPPTTDGRKGFPCTAARLLKGNGHQSTMSNQGEMCCGMTPSSGFKGAGDGKTIKKEIDISSCKFNKVSYALTDMRGDQGTLKYVHGATAFVRQGTSKNKMWVYVYTGGRYQYWRAAQWHWKIQWCAFGY